jgi:hypothetical protein
VSEWGDGPRTAVQRRPAVLTHRFQSLDMESDLSEPISRRASAEPSTIPMPDSPWRLWHGARREDVWDVRDDEMTMDAIKRAHVERLRERIERSRYRVDPEAVAAAIVARLTGHMGGENGRAAVDPAAARPAHPGA